MRNHVQWGRKTYINQPLIRALKYWSMPEWVEVFYGEI